MRRRGRFADCDAAALLLRNLAPAAIRHGSEILKVSGATSTFRREQSVARYDPSSPDWFPEHIDRDTSESDC